MYEHGGSATAKRQNFDRKFSKIISLGFQGIMVLFPIVEDGQKMCLVRYMYWQSGGIYGIIACVLNSSFMFSRQKDPSLDIQANCDDDTCVLLPVAVLCFLHGKPQYLKSCLSC